MGGGREVGERGGLVSIELSMNECKRNAKRQRSQVFESITNMRYDCRHRQRHMHKREQSMNVTQLHIQHCDILFLMSGINTWLGNLRDTFIHKHTRAHTHT